MITTMIATLLSPEYVGWTIAVPLLVVLVLVHLSTRQQQPAPSDDDPRSLRYEITWPTRDLVSVADGIWRDADGGYVFSAPYLAHLAEQFPTLDCRRLLGIATQIALSAEGCPPLTISLRQEVDHAA